MFWNQVQQQNLLRRFIMRDFIQSQLKYKDNCNRTGDFIRINRKGTPRLASTKMSKLRMSAPKVIKPRPLLITTNRIINVWNGISENADHSRRRNFDSCRRNSTNAHKLNENLFIIWSWPRNPNTLLHIFITNYAADPVVELGNGYCSLIEIFVLYVIIVLRKSHHLGKILNCNFY